MGNWRKAKEAEIARRGGGCERCGYHRCLRALQFHHLDASEKRTWRDAGGISKAELMAHPERFMMLCANCHFEAHEEDDRKRHTYADCQQCGASFRVHQVKAEGRGRFCSRGCAYRSWEAKSISRESLIPRFWKYANKVDVGCWIWSGPTAGKDRPSLIYRIGIKQSKHRSAAHISYELRHGPLPPNIRLYHTCANPRCVNPDHLRRGRRYYATMVGSV